MPRYIREGSARHLPAEDDAGRLDESHQDQLQFLPPPRPASRYGRAALHLDLTLLRSALVLHNELLECGKLLCHDRLRRLIDKFRVGTKFCVG
jgi:hypothetical protein